MKALLISSLPFIGSLVRHSLTVGAGYLVQHGLATADQSQAVYGGLMAAGAILWSFYQKKAG